MENIPISLAGFKLVKQQLERLKKERPGVIQAIKEAREEGDLRENAGYDAARERQGMLEARINYIESRMAKFTVIDVKTLGGKKISYGATVELEEIKTGERKRYTLLGPDETAFFAGSISVFSPIGRALLGKEEGEGTVVNAPRGRVEYVIVSVVFQDLGLAF